MHGGPEMNDELFRDNKRIFKLEDRDYVRGKQSVCAGCDLCGGDVCQAPPELRELCIRQRKRYRQVGEEITVDKFYDDPERERAKRQREYNKFVQKMIRKRWKRSQ